MPNRSTFRKIGALTFFPYLIWAEPNDLRFRPPDEELSETMEEHVFIEKFLDLADAALKIWNQTDSRWRDAG
jgi:hypothetical protein